jgi:hypothetical protein
MGKWNHLGINQKIPEQQNGKAWHPGTTDNSHTRHCTHASESTDVKAQNFIHPRNTVLIG